jgi:cell division protein ZapA
MSEKIINASISILGKIYPIRCQESELHSLEQAAAYLNEQMMEVQDSGKVINLERIAIITALNITNQLLQQSQQKNNLMNKISQHLNRLQEKLDIVFNKSTQTEFFS